MNVTYACPHCHETSRCEFSADTREIVCRHCSRSVQIPPEAIRGGRLQRCLVCPSHDLYVRKDFPQRVGVALVVAGILGSSVAWYYSALYWTYGILFATALVDFVLFLIVGNALMCYRCHAQYRGIAEMDEHEAFNLETHERYRQQAARLGKQT